jgi:hypothetical protein
MNSDDRIATKNVVVRVSDISHIKRLRYNFYNVFSIFLS